MTPVKTPLNPAEKSALAECEAVIKRGVGTFVEVGNALMRIRDERLYRVTHKTFEIYCRETWGWARKHADKLIGSAGVIRNLTPIGGILPKTETQTRPLVALPPEKQREIWKEIVESTPPEEITEKVVSEHVRRDKGWEVVEKRPNYLEQFKRLWRECNKQEKAAILKWARQNK